MQLAAYPLPAPTVSDPMPRANALGNNRNELRMRCAILRCHDIIKILVGMAATQEHVAVLSV